LNNKIWGANTLALANFELPRCFSPWIWSRWYFL